jgi:hypothetical protein
MELDHLDLQILSRKYSRIRDKPHYFFIIAINEETDFKMKRLLAKNLLKLASLLLTEETSPTVPNSAEFVANSSYSTVPKGDTGVSSFSSLPGEACKNENGKEPLAPTIEKEKEADSILPTGDCKNHMKCMRNPLWEGLG